MRTRTRMLGPLLLLLAAPLAASEPGGAVLDETVRGEIELGFVNGVWADLDSGFQPVRRGGLTIHVSSPEHRVTVHRNRLSLSRNGEGPVDASLEVEFEGEGEIVADLVGAGLENRIEDRVTAPRQSAAAWAKVRFERDEGGYLMTVVEAQPKVDLEIKSDMAGRLVALCRVFEKLPLIPVDCAGIETALSVVTVPLPGPGEQFLIPGERLTEEEKAFFERFL